MAPHDPKQPLSEDSLSEPRIVLPWSLRQQCLNEVRRNVLRWSKSREDRTDDNPFVDCPLRLRQDLLEWVTAGERRSSALKRIAELLLESGLESFDLSCLDDVDFSELQLIFDLLVRHGSSLRQLTIAGLWMYSSENVEVIKRLLRSVPNLQQLRIQDVYHEEMQIIARYCPRLQRLEVMHHSLNFSDISEFVSTVIREDLPIRNTLREVHLSSSVDGEGVLAFIETFPNLEIVRCVYLEQVLDRLDESPEDRIHWWRKRLSKIRVLQNGQPMGYDSVERMVSWFPNLEEVVLHVQEGMNLQELARLHNLKSLKLRNSPTLPASYPDDVLPLLAQCGRRLVRLGLEHFDVVDLAKTSTLCPDLESLSAQWFTLLGCFPISRNARPFQNLKYLLLRPRASRYISEDACELLLSNSLNLRQMEVFSCFGLSDRLASVITSRNGLKNLRTVWLRHGHGLSDQGLQTFLSKAERLRFFDAGKLPRCNSVEQEQQPEEEEDDVQM